MVENDTWKSFLEKLIENTVWKKPTEDLQNKVIKKTNDILDKQEVILEYKRESFDKESLMLKIWELIEKEDFSELKTMISVIEKDDIQIWYYNYFHSVLTEVFETEIEKLLKNKVVGANDTKIGNLLKIAKKYDISVYNIANNFTKDRFIDPFDLECFKNEIKLFKDFKIDLTEWVNKWLEEWWYWNDTFFDVINIIKNNNLKIDLTVFNPKVSNKVKGLLTTWSFNNLEKFIIKLEKVGIDIDIDIKNYKEEIEKWILYHSYYDINNDIGLAIKWLEKYIKLGFNLKDSKNYNKIQKCINDIFKKLILFKINSNELKKILQIIEKYDININDWVNYFLVNWIFKPFEESLEVINEFNINIDLKSKSRAFQKWINETLKDWRLYMFESWIKITEKYDIKIDLKNKEKLIQKWTIKLFRNWSMGDIENMLNYTYKNNIFIDDSIDIWIKKLIDTWNIDRLNKVISIFENLEFYKMDFKKYEKNFNVLVEKLFKNKQLIIGNINNIFDITSKLDIDINKWIQNYLKSIDYQNLTITKEDIIKLIKFLNNNKIFDKIIFDYCLKNYNPDSFSNLEEVFLKNDISDTFNKYISSKWVDYISAEERQNNIKNTNKNQELLDSSIININSLYIDENDRNLVLYFRNENMNEFIFLIITKAISLYIWKYSKVFNKIVLVSRDPNKYPNYIHKITPEIVYKNVIWDEFKKTTTIYSNTIHFTHWRTWESGFEWMKTSIPIICKANEKDSRDECRSNWKRTVTLDLLFKDKKLSWIKEINEKSIHLIISKVLDSIVQCENMMLKEAENINHPDYEKLQNNINL